MDKIPNSGGLTRADVPIFAVWSVMAFVFADKVAEGGHLWTPCSSGSSLSNGGRSHTLKAFRKEPTVNAPGRLKARRYADLCRRLKILQTLASSA